MCGSFPLSATHPALLCRRKKKIQPATHAPTHVQKRKPAQDPHNTHTSGLKSTICCRFYNNSLASKDEFEDFRHHYVHLNVPKNMLQRDETPGDECSKKYAPERRNSWRC